jgi:hypothetical protein
MSPCKQGFCAMDADERGLGQVRYNATDDTNVGAAKSARQELGTLGRGDGNSDDDGGGARV